MAELVDACPACLGPDYAPHDRAECILSLRLERDQLRADLDAARGELRTKLDGERTRHLNAEVEMHDVIRRRNEEVAYLRRAVSAQKRSDDTARRLRAALEDCLYEHALPEGRACQCERCQGIREAQASA